MNLRPMSPETLIPCTEMSRIRRQAGNTQRIPMTSRNYVKTESTNIHSQDVLIAQSTQVSRAAINTCHNWSSPVMTGEAVKMLRAAIYLLLSELAGKWL